MESEFITLDKAGEEVKWFRHFLEDITLWSKPVNVICIYCDNLVVSMRAKNSVYNGKSRYIRRMHNTIRQLLTNGIITIDYVKSKENIADPLTKEMTRGQVTYTTKGMGLKPMK